MDRADASAPRVSFLLAAPHTGIFLLALLAAVWIALETPTLEAPSRWLTGAFTLCAFWVLCLQIGWSFHCIAAESQSPYDPGRQACQTIRSDYAGKRIAGFGFESVSTQAWAPRSLFFNQPDAFWHWSATISADNRRSEVLRQHPDVVVIADTISGKESFYNQWATWSPANEHFYLPLIQFWERNGYSETHRFCGDRFMRLGVTNSLCEVILEPRPVQSPNDPAQESRRP